VGCASVPATQPVAQATTAPATLVPTKAPAQPTSTVAPAPKKTTLRVAVQQDIQTLDPMLAGATGDEYNAYWAFGRLTWYDSTMLKAIPQVAESWTISDDGLTYVFKIRKGVKFHNGREVTAEDVVFSWDRIFQIGDKGRGKLELADVDTYKATGPYEFTVKLKRFNPVFDRVMGQWSLVIIPKEDADKVETKPVSCGPYKFVEWLPNDHAKYVKYDGFWDKAKLAQLPDEIIFLPVKEEQTRITMLKTGQVDVIDGVSAQNWKDIRNTTGLQLLEQDITSAYFVLVFNYQKGPTADKKLRQALSYAFDRDAIIQSVLKGAGKADCAYIPEGHWAYSKMNCPPYDPAKAKQMLKDAGLDKGVKLRIRTYSQAVYTPAAEVFQQYLRDVGIDAQIDMLERAVWLEQVWRAGPKDFEVTFGLFTREPDPDGLMQSVFRKGGGNNGGDYYNPKVEELFDLGKSVRDEAKRREYYRQIQEILLDDLPDIKVSSVTFAAAATKKVKGLVLWPKGTIQFDNVSMEP
jgi:peptide/nickel transport system substrate-binding protein